MKFGLQTVCTADLEIDGVVALAKAEGLQGLELATGYLGKFRGEPDGPQWHINTDDLLASAEAAALLAKDAGIEIFAFATRCDAEQTDLIEPICRAAQSIGCSFVRVGPGRYDAELGFWGSMERSRRHLGAAVEIARKYGVRLVVELHDHTMADGVLACHELVKDFSPKDLGIIFDVGNAKIHGYQPWAEALDILLPHISHVHLKDMQWVLENGKWTTTFAGPGEGLVDWAEVLKLLTERGFDGYLSIEDYRGGWCKKNPDWPAERKVREWRTYVEKILADL
jgi:sugar phosphate isomerase/epimerase